MTSGRDQFLEKTGWVGASVQGLAQDMSRRSYSRLTKNGRTAILLESVPDEDPKSLPGHKLRDTVRISKGLRDAGLNAPEVLEAELAAGFLLLKDLGTSSFADAPDYALATDVLIHLRESFPENTLELGAYQSSHIHKNLRYFVDYYLPESREQYNPDGLAEEYLGVWQDIESGLPECPQGFVHGDYHAGNLLLCDSSSLPPPLRGEVQEGVENLKRLGILDFQGALWGPVPYDLVNLLEDARRDVPEDIKTAMMERYCEGLEDREAFEAWYKVLKLQFHSRVIGQFIKIANEGKKEYLEFVPGLAARIEQSLQDPLFSALKDIINGDTINGDTLV